MTAAASQATKHQPCWHSHSSQLQQHQNHGSISAARTKEEIEDGSGLAIIAKCIDQKYVNISRTQIHPQWQGHWHDGGTAVAQQPTQGTLLSWVPKYSLAKSFTNRITNPYNMFYLPQGTLLSTKGHQQNHQVWPCQEEAATNKYWISQSYGMTAPPTCNLKSQSNLIKNYGTSLHQRGSSITSKDSHITIQTTWSKSN